MFNINNIVVKEIKVEGNDFWFDAAQYGHNPDQNLHVKFIREDKEFNLHERVCAEENGDCYKFMEITDQHDNTVFRDRAEGCWGSYEDEDVNNFIKHLRSLV